MKTSTPNVKTAGSINQVGAVMGLLGCMGATNEETLDNMRRLFCVIAAPCVVTKDGIGVPTEDVAAFLKTGAIK